MIAQALSGIAKDLNKMSAKSAIKLLVPKDAESKLYQWVAILTGSKNALKGVGFFMGGLLLTLMGFKGAVILMAALLAIVWVFSLLMLNEDIGKATNKPKFKDVFSKSPAINILFCGTYVFIWRYEMFGLWWRCRYFWQRHLTGAIGGLAVHGQLGDWLWHCAVCCSLLYG